MPRLTYQYYLAARQDLHLLRLADLSGLVPLSGSGQWDLFAYFIPIEQCQRRLKSDPLSSLNVDPLGLFVTGPRGC